MTNFHELKEIFQFFPIVSDFGKVWRKKTFLALFLRQKHESAFIFAKIFFSIFDVEDPFGLIAKNELNQIFTKRRVSKVSKKSLIFKTKKFRKEIFKCISPKIDFLKIRFLCIFN